MPQALPSIVWRRLDVPGHESARLSSDAGTPVLEGKAVFEGEEAGALAYTVTCDRAWRTTSADVDGWLGGRPVALRIRRDATGRWIVNGVLTPSLDGCDDVDLSITPSTNALPIRRLALKVGETATAIAAWWKGPDPTLTPLDQTYERVGPSTYRYTSAGGTFVALLEVRADGLVTRYPGLWEERPNVSSADL
jgi:hypothetical protein